ncbi:acyl-CoA dehydrogenase family protein [Streptomyces sp. NBC_01187]|uniref:acyl-CoA dehydrogenase family protein n=1 Tax=Streptomyces sp. NBC_01187 TaxID=2903766 RepID=UPI0038646C66|nr:acyl-CoA/acyl-ACP dehydrogenase [Streptomyces sp. NBC_01187]
MDTAFTEEQDEMRRTVRELLARRCGPDEVKAAVRTEPGYDTRLWHTLAAQLGLPGLALPERYGGVGCGTLELALAAEETGRALLPSPLFATAALVAPLLLSLGTDEQRARLLPRLASGELTAALAVPAGVLPLALGLTGPGAGPASGEAVGQTVGPATGPAAPDDWAGGGRAGGMQAYRDGDGWRLYGEAGQVLGGHSAGLLLVAAHAGGFARSRTLLFLVHTEPDGAHPEPDGVVRIRQTALDETRPVARVELRDVAAEMLGSGDGGDVRETLVQAGPGAAAVLAAEAVGAADSALSRTVEYTGLREQFGRPIGSFQAVRHRLADVYVQVQAARSAAYYAAWAADADAGEAATAGGLALAQGLEALRLAAGEAVQFHGGVGFTWEHEAHLYFKRAAGDDLLFGPVHRLRARAAERAALFGPTGQGKEGRGKEGRKEKSRGTEGRGTEGERDARVAGEAVGV